MVIIMTNRIYSMIKQIFRRFSKLGRFDFSLPEPVIDTSKEKVLDVGCGTAKMPGSTGIDIVNLDGVDIVHDLNILPWKDIDDESYNWILMKDVIEHLEDSIAIFKECHRILKPDGKLYIRTGYWNHRYAFADPTHKRFFTEETFEFFTGKRREYYMDFHFKDMKIDYTFDPMAVKKFGTNRKKLMKRSKFHCNVIDGIHVILTK